MSGWIKIHRKIYDHWIFEDAKKFKWWIDILMLTNHTDKKTVIGGKLTVIKRGTFHTSELKLAERWSVSRNTVRSFLSLLEVDDMITTTKTINGTTIKVHNYNDYQDKNLEKKQLTEQQNEHKKDNELNNELNKTKNVKNEKNEKNKYIVDYLNEKTGKDFKFTTKKTQSLINARLKEGFTEDDFKRVIDNKCSEWLKDEKMNQYLRPDTLFGTKFESYLNQNTKTTNVINFSNDNEKFNLWEV